MQDHIYFEEVPHEPREPSERVNLIWSHSCWNLGFDTIGACAVVMTPPPVDPGISTIHQRYLIMYGTKLAQNQTLKCY